MVSRRLTNRLVLAAAWTAIVLPASAAQFDLVATHPDAAAQSTAVGQMISTLKPFNGKLYAGYGNYDPMNTGPIGIRAFDPAIGAFTDNLLTWPQPPHGAETNAILNFREIRGNLYAPHIDPWPDPPPAGELGGFSLGIASGASETWSDHRVVQGIHIFDIATFDGTDLWLVGSSGSNAVAWRKRNEASEWEVSLVVPPQTAGTFARFYAIHAYNGKLYTQGQEANPWGPHPTSKVFDGTSWSDGPSLGGGYVGNTWRPETFAGEMVYDRVRGGQPGRISKFNGTRTTLAYPDANVTFYDYTIDGSVLYALASDGRIIYTSDLNSWRFLANAPATGRSLGMLDDTLYVGGTAGQLFRYSLTHPALAQWSVDADGAWSNAANWSGVRPVGVGAVARFGSAIRAPRQVNLTTPIVIGSIIFDNDNTYDITGPATLTLDASPGAAGEITSLRSASHVISAPFTLADNTTVHVAQAPAKLTLSSLNQTTAILTKTGPGTLEVNRLRAGGLNIEAGKVRIAPLVPTPGSDTSLVGQLTLAGTAGAWTATLDITDNDLVIGGVNTADDLARIVDQIKNGRDRGQDGRWSGAGITSSAAAENTVTGIAAVLMTASGNIALKHTYNGDANLDGLVNADDYFRIDSGFLAQPASPGYDQGDFNYDGTINADDYFLIDSAFLGQGAPLGGNVLAVAAVPEPAQALLILIGAALLATRRRSARRPPLPRLLY